MTGFSTSLARDLNIFHRALSNPVRLKKTEIQDRNHEREALLAEFQVMSLTDFWTAHPCLVHIIYSRKYPNFSLNQLLNRMRFQQITQF